MAVTATMTRSYKRVSGKIAAQFLSSSVVSSQNFSKGIVNDHQEHETKEA